MNNLKQCMQIKINIPVHYNPVNSLMKPITLSELIKMQKGEFSRKMIYGKRRRCTMRATKKYLSRPSPPYPANDCCGMKKIGNDGSKYVSKPNANGICFWKKMK